MTRENFERSFSSDIIVGFPLTNNIVIRKSPLRVCNINNNCSMRVNNLEKLYRVRIDGKEISEYLENMDFIQYVVNTKIKYVN